MMWLILIEYMKDMLPVVVEPYLGRVVLVTSHTGSIIDMV